MGLFLWTHVALLPILSMIIEIRKGSAMEKINVLCAYCGLSISSQEKIEFMGTDCFHHNCHLIAGMEMNHVSWEKTTPQEQDAVNLLLSQEADNDVGI